MKKTFEYRIYPNTAQTELIAKAFGCCRYVYNRVLDMRNKQHEAGEKTRGITFYITKIPQWKRSDAPWLSEVDSMALQQSLRNLDRGYRNYFRSSGEAGFPKFKSKRTSRQSYRTNVASILDEKHNKLPKVGIIKARISRPKTSGHE